MNEQKYNVVDKGHAYELFNTDGSTQELRFIKKEPVNEGSTELTTVQEGTTNEAVIAVLVDRLEVLDEKMPSHHNKSAITHLKEALADLLQRTAERTESGTEGTNQA